RGGAHRRPAHRRCRAGAVARRHRPGPGAERVRAGRGVRGAPARHPGQRPDRRGGAGRSGGRGRGLPARGRAGAGDRGGGGGAGGGGGGAGGGGAALAVPVVRRHGGGGGGGGGVVVGHGQPRDRPDGTARADLVAARVGEGSGRGVAVA